MKPVSNIVYIPMIREAQVRPLKGGRTELEKVGVWLWLTLVFSCDIRGVFVFVRGVI